MWIARGSAVPDMTGSSVAEKACFSAGPRWALLVSGSASLSLEVSFAEGLGRATRLVNEWKGDIALLGTSAYRVTSIG
jgi:hypothetical protein